MDRLKKIANQYITSDVIEKGIELSVKILVKVIEKKFLNFVEKNNIEFRNTKEEKELREYFKNRYINKIKR